MPLLNRLDPIQHLDDVATERDAGRTHFAQRLPQNVELPLYRWRLLSACVFDVAVVNDPPAHGCSIVNSISTGGNERTVTTYDPGSGNTNSIVESVAS